MRETQLNSKLIDIELICECLIYLQDQTNFLEIKLYADKYIDGHESKPAISILAIVENSQQTSNFCYFATYSFHVPT